MIQKLMERSGRAEAQATVAQGITEISRAVDGQFRAQQLFFCPKWCDRQVAEKFAQQLDVPGDGLFEVTPEVYQKLAFGQRQDGLLAVIPTKDLSLSDLRLQEKWLLLVVEGTEKPGNLGAIFRSADAAGADAIVIVSSKCDAWGPNVVRASLGTVFTVPFCVVDAEAAVNWLQGTGARVVTADPAGERLIWEVDFSPPVAIVLGAEHEGLSDAWRTVARTSARIPMFGHADSLNVSVSAALFLYEAVRQRLRPHRG